MSTKLANSCPICLDTVKKTELAKINSCTHIFCNECIVEWSSRSNTCPVCRSRFNSIQRGRKKLKVEEKNIVLEEDFSLWDPSWFDSDFSDEPFSDDSERDSEDSSELDSVSDDLSDDTSSDEEEYTPFSPAESSERKGPIIDLDPSEDENIETNNKRARKVEDTDSE